MKREFTLSILVWLLILTSCKEESCPEPFCTTTFNVSTEFLNGTDTLPVSKLTLFILNESTGKTIGPSYLDISGVSKTANTFTVTHILPYGKFKLWVWGNVEDESIYSFNRYSISLKNNVVGADYQLAPVRDVDINSRKATIDITMERLTAVMNLAVEGSVTNGVSLYVSDIFTQVNAAKKYKAEENTADVLQFEKGDIPPARIFLFPSCTEPATTSVSFSYMSEDGVRHNESTSHMAVKAGKVYTVRFAGI